ncbi:MAG: alpha/beta fold hydrolase [Syntrophomonadaceae bacterium]|nr:alpha/beta fold hydrolase [Syntrophomonadaceae bacterium]
MPDYSALDQPVLLQYLFYPRKDFSACPQNACDFFVPVERGISISTRFYEAGKEWPWILYFHGNGEVVSDYDAIAAFYNFQRLNLVVADYRGYGASGGNPSFFSLIKDAHSIFKTVEKKIADKTAPFSLWLMGRSLGSISALELAYHYQDRVKGLIIESGFASVTRLVKHLGLPAYDVDLDKIEKECLEMITKIKIPALVIHGQHDALVPLQEGRLVFEKLGTEKKELVVIPFADHNNIMFVDLNRYFEVIKKFIHQV